MEQYQPITTLMSNTVVVTSIYREFWGTEQFYKSLERLDIPVHNAFKGTHMTGDGQLLRWIYEAYVELRDKYKYAIYSDGADTYFVKSFKVPDNKIIYSAEKAIWPPTDKMKRKWEDYYYSVNRDSNLLWGKDFKVSPWKYLNGGNCCGPIELLIEFFEKYGIVEHVNENVNGQGVMAEAFLKAKADGFPIELDTRCEYFQTTGFAESTDFKFYGLFSSITGVNTRFVMNEITGTHPAVLHGNGRTDMAHIYKYFD